MTSPAATVVNRLAARFGALSMRERVLITLSVIAVAWLIWDWSIGQGQRAEIDRASRELDGIRQRIALEVKEQDGLRAASLVDPNDALRKERMSLEAEVAALDARLEETVGRFVPPTQMPKLLESVVARHQGVSLVRVKSLAAEPVRVSQDKEPSLFRHPLQVELDGDYFAIKRYLEDLEGSSWRFAWRSFEYRVVEHPRAKVLFEIETLSPDRNWLGV